MDILTLIKRRCTIRKYKNKRIPKRIFNKIIEAGRWGPSVPSFLRIQPWKFVVISNRNTINKLSNIAIKKSKASGAGVNILLHSASNIIKGADIVIAVYKSGEMDKIKGKYKEIYKRFSGIIEMAQLAAISAAIQNMILESESLRVGSCWLDTPLFCKKKINALLKTKNDLIAILTLGYADETGKRSPRKLISEAVQFIR